MSLSSRYSLIETRLESHFKDNIINLSYNIRGRMRVLFKNGAVFDIRYPIRTTYSFHLNYSSKMYRIDTAPHHTNLATFPSHCHYEMENNIIEDKWTNPDKSVGENIEGLIMWLDSIFNT